MRIITLLILTFVTAITSAQNIESLYSQAEIHYSLHEFDEALTDINKAIEKKKKYYDAYLLRAKIYADTDRQKDALDELDYVLENFPAPDEAYFQKGMLFYDEEKYTEALTNFDEATRLYFQDSEYYYYQGETAMYLKLMSKACTAWDYGQKLKDEHCEEMFTKHCDGIELIEPEPIEINNPFKRRR